MLTIELAPEAEEDPGRSLQFIAQRNPSAARKLAARIFTTIEKLGAGTREGPELRLTTGERVHSWPVPPFRTYYQREPDRLRVLRVYHQAGRPLGV